MKYTKINKKIINISLLLIFILILFLLLKNLNTSKEGFNQSCIPKIIIQTSKEPPKEYIITQIKNLSPGWEYKHFTDETIIKFFKTHYIKEFKNIIHKFNSFTNGAHKADLFRYYYIYINGGVFIDSDAMIQVNINDIVKDYCFISVKSNVVPNSIFQGLIGANPYNIIIYEALKNAYNTNNDDLNNDYLLFVKNLYTIIHQLQISKLINFKIKLYTEDYHTINIAKTYDEEDYNKLILFHYFTNKIIPDYKQL